MERPSADTIAYFDRLMPNDLRATRGQMFGHPCAFVNGHMFYGTFAQSVVVRVGAARATTLGLPIFEPMAGRAWREYIQVEPGAIEDARLAELLELALDETAKLPPKEKKAPRRK